AKFRSVLKRYERIKELFTAEKWSPEKDSIYKLPKIKRVRFKAKKVKAEGAEGADAAAAKGAAPAAAKGAAAAPAKGAAAPDKGKAAGKPAAGKDAKK
ncbi:MAG: hypothetical protein PHT95_01900, partial [Candidatus Omnitrophica bacterium]|nr:hypothetical protein [Candidatus Omnitrophota bacterium]